MKSLEKLIESDRTLSQIERIGNIPPGKALEYWHKLLAQKDRLLAENERLKDGLKSSKTLSNNASYSGSRKGDHSGISE
jgi:hypothetical protein